MYNTSACSKKSKNAFFMMSLNYRGIMKSKLLAIALAAVTTVSVAEAKETKSTKAATVKSSSQSGKMYLRADAGYGFSKFRTTGFKENAKGTILSGGLGYNVNDNVRAELQLYHNLGAEAEKKVSGAKVGFEQKTTAVMANAYYDFKNSSIFTPYVMAGAGVAHNKLNTKASVGSFSTSVKSKSSNNLALQTGAGVATKIADNAMFDVRYNLMNKGVDYKFQDGTKLKTGVEHSVLAGVRFVF